VVEPAAAVFAALIVDPIPDKSVAAVATDSGTANRNDI
jgi:hypothetical protein